MTDAMDHKVRAATRDRHPIERADARVAAAVAPVRHHPVTRAMATLSDLLDQPPMVALCLGTIAAGAVRRDSRLAITGARMLTAMAIATAVKTVVKDRVDRTRPRLLVDDGDYAMAAGDSDESDLRSFPSGHTAGGVAVVRALARGYPGTAVPAGVSLATLVAALIPKQAHYASDLAAGAAIGWGAELASDAIWSAVTGRRADGQGPREDVVSLARDPI